MQNDNQQTACKLLSYPIFSNIHDALVCCTCKNAQMTHFYF